MNVYRIIHPTPKRFPKPDTQITLREFLVAPPNNNNNSQVLISPRGTYSPDIQEQYETSLVDRSSEYRDPITFESIKNKPEIKTYTRLRMAPTRDIPAFCNVLRYIASYQLYPTACSNPLFPIMTRKDFEDSIDRWEFNMMNANTPQRKTQRDANLVKIYNWNTRSFTLENWASVIKIIAAGVLRYNDPFIKDLSIRANLFASHWHKVHLAESPASLLLAAYLCEHVFE